MCYLPLKFEISDNVTLFSLKKQLFVKKYTHLTSPVDIYFMKAA